MSVLLLWKPHQGGIGIIASAESVVEELGTDPRAEGPFCLGWYGIVEWVGRRRRRLLLFVVGVLY